MAAKTKKAPAKERLARIQAEKAVANKEKAVETAEKEKAVKKPKKKLTLEDIKKKAQAAVERAERLQREVEQAENPKLAALIEKVAEAEKLAKSKNRFITVRAKGVRTLRRKLEAGERALEDLRRERDTFQASLVKAQSELDKARAEAEASEST